MHIPCCVSLIFHVLNRSIQLNASRVLSNAYVKPSRWLTSTAIPFIDLSKKSINDSYDHLGCIQVFIISLADNLFRSLWNLHRESFLSKTLMSKMNSVWAWWLTLRCCFLLNFFSVLEWVLVHFTTRRSLAQVEERKFFVKISCRQSSALFRLFLRLFCLRRVVFLFLLLFILISVVLCCV